MNIVACVKQVPDTEALIKVKADGSGIEEGGIKWVMNPYDEYGVEEALKLKEANGGEVTIVSLGPARAMETIRTALAMGGDKGVHITIDKADEYNTAAALAAAIKEINPDIIFCGQRAIDDDSAQVGSILAELLGIPQVTIVTALTVADGKIKAVKPIEGAQLVIESPMPCVVTAQKGLNEPRYASLPGIMKAKIIKMTPPPERAAGKIIGGDDPAAKAAELAKLLREEAKVI